MKYLTHVIISYIIIITIIIIILRIHPDSRKLKIYSL